MSSYKPLNQVNQELRKFGVLEFKEVEIPRVNRQGDQSFQREFFDAKNAELFTSTPDDHWLTLSPDTRNVVGQAHLYIHPVTSIN